MGSAPALWGSGVGGAPSDHASNTPSKFGVLTCLGDIQPGPIKGRASVGHSLGEGSR